ncbi:hypothetical protein MFIFM68171_09815 [Madurella fahalii]|uniref:Cytochrome P450 n=1 Tax=Madurella fahalii TaxID=1157608 RepID=A0ABQ0GPF0_9PEZI
MASFLASTDFNAADLAGNVTHAITSHLPEAWAPHVEKLWGPWAAYATLAIVWTYLYDFGSRVYRDRRMRKFGAPPPVVPFRLPFAIDLALYSLYKNARHSLFPLVSSWLDAVPGRTVEMRTFATGLIFTDEPANIKGIMQTKWSSFGRGEVTRRIWGDMLGDTQIFVVDGEDWHKSKDRIKDHVSKLRPTDLLITEQHAQKLFARFDVNKPVEVFDLVDRYQLDVVTEVFFGESAESLTSEPPFRKPMDTLHPINTMRMLFGKNAYYVKDKYLAPKALRDLNAYCYGMADKVYARDLSKKSLEEYTMLEELASQKKSPQEIKESMMSIMLGGKDPSAILISWAIFLAGKHPNVFLKMKEEVERVCGSRPPTPHDIKHFTYIRYVINETFRLYHPLGLNVREALEDTTLPTGGGKSGKEPLAVAKGTTVIYSLGGMQRRKDIWGEDATVFRPERWEGASVDRWHFIPYNHGPRHCIGRVFGQQQMEYILARICQEYEDIRIPPGQPEQRIRIELNLKMAYPCMVEFVRKKKE